MRRQPAREAAARTYARALPVVPVRARGLATEGADGRRYLDCLSGTGTLALGHIHPVVLEAIREVLDSGAPLQASSPATPVKEAFVDELPRTPPPALAAHARVRFCGPCAADAMDTAVALVRAATGRTAVTKCDASRTGADTQAPPAGVLLAPVSAEEGPRPLSDDQLRRTRRLTAERSAALIAADETSTRVGRTGAFWAEDHAGVVPDALILANAIGGGLPLSVVVHHDALDPGDPGGRAGASGGNQLAMAAGRAALTYVRESGLAGHAATLGGARLARLRELSRVHRCVGEVRGRGLMIGIEFVHAGEHAGAHGPGGRPAPGFAAAVRRECLRRGLVVGLCGRSTNVVRMQPPLTTTEEQAAVADRLADAVDSAAHGHPGQAPPCPHPR